MNRGGIRRGLHIDDDDDEVKRPEEHISTNKLMQHLMPIARKPTSRKI